MNLDKYIEELEYLVNIDSGSNTPEGIRKVAKFFKDKCEAIGLVVEMHDFNGGSNPCLEIKNSAAENLDVLLIGHMDTVFEEGTAAAHPFRVEGDKAFGPGIIDMKSCLLSGCYAVKKYMESSNNRLNICIAMNSDEETGSEYSEQWLKEMAKKSSCCMVMEHSRYGGRLVSQRKGICLYKVHIKGEAMHAAGILEGGHSAIHEMARWIVKLDSLNDANAGTSLNIGVISGGSRSNVVAEYADCEVDTRFLSDSEHQRVDECMEALRQESVSRGYDVTVEHDSYRGPMVVTSATRKLMDVVEQAGSMIDVPVNWATASGVSDGNYISSAGTPVIDGMGPCGEGAHSHDEYLYISSVGERIELLCETLMVIDKIKCGGNKHE